MKETEHQSLLDYSLQLSAEEKDQVRHLSEWLPGFIVDSHVHLTPASLLQDIPQEIKTQACATFTHLSLEESTKIRDLLFPGTERLVYLRMPMPFSGVDHKGANNYLKNSLPADDFQIFYGIPDDIDYTVEGMQSLEYVALKMYPFYFPKPDGTIYQYFRPEILEAANDMSFPIILHLPTKVSVCEDQLVEVLQQFPKLPIVLAHMGRERVYTNELDLIYARLRKFPNLFLETSTVPSKDIIKSGISHFGQDRILFGSDEPYNLLRAVVVRLPSGKQRYIAGYQYCWANPEEQRELKTQFPGISDEMILMHLENLEAIKDAIDEVVNTENTREGLKEKIFSYNSVKIFNLD